MSPDDPCPGQAPEDERPPPDDAPRRVSPHAEHGLCLGYYDAVSFTSLDRVLHGLMHARQTYSASTLRAVWTSLGVDMTRIEHIRDIIALELARRDERL